MIGKFPSVFTVAVILCCLPIPCPVDAIGSPGPDGALTYDHSGGFFESPFSLAITAPPGTVTVYYTTNGADPLPGNARRYSGPIPVTTTAIVRASAFGPATNRVAAASRTFLYGPDILNQTGARFPESWGTNDGRPVLAYYRLATAEAAGAGLRPLVAAALRSLPSLSIVANPDDLFSPATGIYTHPLERGRDWERSISLEMYAPDGKLAFQWDCGLRIHGGTSRQPGVSPKHSLRLAFKRRYGPGNLRFPLFGPDGPQEFETLILRAGNNDSWLAQPGAGGRRADYLRDEWMRRSMQAMGHPSARGRFVHLYLNGLYWGIYDLCESPGPDLLPACQTASAAAFDVRKAGQVESGDALAWNQMLRLANAGLDDDQRYGQISQCLDLPELADYLILNFYAGNSDWDRSANWVAIRPRTPSGRFQFLVWDGECTLGNVDANTLDFDDDESPPRLFHQLAQNARFRKLFAARAEQLLLQNGALSTAQAGRRYRELAASIAPAMDAEAARWGACQRDVYPSRPVPVFTVEKDWQPEVNRLQNFYFPQRPKVLLKEFQDYGLGKGINGK
jgi:hypothetical protein